MVRLLIAALLVLHLHCIIVPLQNNHPRCMIVYAFGEKETIKLDMKFPPIPNHQPDEVYEVFYKNTDTNETHYENVQPGNFK